MLYVPWWDTNKELSEGNVVVWFCRRLLQQPDVLLLDEPTNHLDAESVFGYNI
jgi:ATPase subunit of ABC transporter with duplicated ATPase domains